MQTLNQATDQNTPSMEEVDSYPFSYSHGMITPKVLVAELFDYLPKTNEHLTYSESEETFYVNGKAMGKDDMHHALMHTAHDMIWGNPHTGEHVDTYVAYETRPLFYDAALAAVKQQLLSTGQVI